MDLETETDNDVSMNISDYTISNTFSDHREIMENYEELKKTYKTAIKKITRFELPTIIGFRAVQIANNAPVMVEVPKHMTNTLEIAEYEFKKGKTPFILKKRVGDSFEYWKLEDLISPL